MKRPLLLVGIGLMLLLGFLTGEALRLAETPVATFNAVAHESRSPHWPAVRKAHLQKEPVCCVCGSKHNLQVHHKQPFHLHPELELDDANLITLCERCHLVFGHLDHYNSYNPDVEKDADVWRAKIEHRP